MSSTILPCPFCGRQPVIEPAPSGGVRLRHAGIGEGCDAVECLLAARVISHADTADAVVGRWNTRRAPLDLVDACRQGGM